LSETDRQAYTGDFESGELETTYRIVADAGAFSLEVGDRPPIAMISAGTDRMRIAQAGLELTFTRDAAGKVTGFHLNAGRVRGIVFTRRSFGVRP